ncbi:hypothetical protein [Pelagicoccus mobilis]|uniref:Glycogen debranching enzyme C-terminal domain-containing protein n=1 Tax=Pelagicoccus mobilis TaxID=415221 RepID=A0A934VKB3_9BACT|nr:hypothetical protein [Pelagicoccus mobilis]MBK1876486.1 hypothetical protein [Pelagicoccus mobilis]
MPLPQAPHSLLAVSAFLATTLFASFSDTQAKPPSFEENAEWMRAEMARLVLNSRGELPDGRTVFFADKTKHYNLIFTRGFGYLQEWVGDLLTFEERKGYLEYLLDGQREDGCIPDRVNFKGRPIYSPGGENKPLADHAVDNASFLASSACLYFQDSGDIAFFRDAEPKLRRGLDFIRRADNGLVFNPTDNPECVYGFTDIVQKTGHLLFSSVLYYKACRDMEAASEQTGVGNPAEYRRRADLIKENIGLLWDKKSGAFFAADEQCHQIDIWGTAFVIYHGLATKRQERKALKFLVSEYDNYAQNGQIRHLLSPETWSDLFVDKPAGVYQNGAYWATPLNWFIPVLEKASPELAQKTLEECITDFKARGINEWVYNENVKLPGYLVSASSVYSLIRE